MFKVESQARFEMEVESSSTGNNMMLSSCFYSDDVIKDAGGTEEEEDEFAMAIDSIRSSISGNVQEGLLPLLSSSLPSMQFANFSIDSSVADGHSLPVTEIEETLADIVEEAAQHLHHHCHHRSQDGGDAVQQESLNEATGVRRRLEPILEETEGNGDRSSSSIPQSPSRKALGNLTNAPRPAMAVRKLDFGSRPQHWSVANAGSLDDELPIPKVRRTMSMSLGGGFFLLPGREEPSRPLDEIPSFSSTKDAIPRISTSTILGLLDGTYAHLYDRLLIVDARYPYEYAGGHLPGAVNLCGLDAAEKYLFSPALQEHTDLSRTVVVFHCEFSSERAPRMALHVRGLDRSINAQRYPHLHFPHLFILEGGYRSFFQAFPQRCEPPGQYLPMRNPRFKDELRFHQRMKQLAKEKLPVSRRVTGSVDSPRLVSLRKSASAFVGRERVTHLTREFYAARPGALQPRFAEGELVADFPSSDGPDVMHQQGLFHQNCFEH